MIIRNGVRHNTSNFGGSGNANIVKLTQSEYNALPESKNSDGILYAITDGECSASGGSSKPVELTKAEYEALGDKVNSDGILYAITDGDGLSAKSMAFDDTETQLGVNNVQDAIVEQNKNFKIENISITLNSEYGAVVSQNAGFKQNGIYYVEALLNITKAIPTTVSAIGIVENNSLIIFNRRVDAILQSTTYGSFLVATNGQDTFYPNSANVEPGVYKFSMVYQP